MFRLEEVSYVLNGRALLQDISFRLQPKEFIAVVGPNGAGKSTLLKILSGDLSPSAGRVSLDEKPLSAWRNLEQAQRRAILPQESSLSFPFLAYDVALMGRNPHCHGAPQAKDEQITLAALQRTEAVHLARREYPYLSGGEKQRVQLARVLAQVWQEDTDSPAHYLLLDEPTNNLDLAHQHHSLQVAKRFAQEGAGVLAVLHDLNLAAQYADRIVLLCQGRMISMGTPEDVFTPDTLCHTFNMPVMVTKHPCFDCPLIVSSLGSTTDSIPDTHKTPDATGTPVTTITHSVVMEDTTRLEQVW